MQLPVRLGDFDLTDLLGEGGTGEVYGATKGGVAVAVKILRGDLALTDRERRRFLDEAAKMRRVTHPSIVRVLEVGTLPDGRPFLSMPRLEGETLASRVRRGPLDKDAALRIFGELGDAVATLHRAGLVHRDIKPENVLVTNGRAILLDLGIARDVHAKSSTTTEEGKMRGTPAYMAPERFFGAPASVASDLYELAVVLYSMLTGNLPWNEAAGPAGRLHPVHPDTWGTAQPPLLAATLLRALSTRPEIRPRSAEEFVADIEHAACAGADTVVFATRSTERQAIASAPVQAHAAPVDTQPSQRRRTRSALIIAAGVGLVTATTLGLLAARSTSPSAAASVPVSVPVPASPGTAATAASASPLGTSLAAPPPSALPVRSKVRPSVSSTPGPRSNEELFLDRR